MHSVFAPLTFILWGAGMTLALWVEAPFATGAWFTAVVLLACAFIGRSVVLNEEAQ